MVFLLLGKTAEEKASSLTASFLFAVHPAKRNFLLCALRAFVVQIFKLGCGHSPP
jgi:hypothetical protein